MTNREISFLLRRRGLTPPADAEQAKQMAIEQRSQDKEAVSQMSVRELKEGLAGVDISTIVEADELRRKLRQKMERDLFNRTRPNRPDRKWDETISSV